MAERLGPAEKYGESNRGGGGRGVPLCVRCPECIDGAGGSSERSRRQQSKAIGNIVATGARTDDVFRCSREAGSYITRKYQLHHRTCGYTWWSVHPDARRTWEAEFGDG